MCVDDFGLTQDLAQVQLSIRRPSQLHVLLFEVFGLGSLEL